MAGAGRPRRRLALLIDVERHGGAEQGRQRRGVDPVAFAEVDGAPEVPAEARVEETRRILERRAPGERHLDHLFVRLARADDAGVRKDRRPHPLPLLDDLGIRSVDDLSQPRERLPAPVAELLDPRVDQRRGRRRRNRLLHVEIHRRT
jgi:hypothetical protein